MIESTSARMQHDAGADFKVPLSMFSGRNVEHGSRVGCSKIDASIASSGTATQYRYVEVVDTQV